ncbi:hypothetical protein DL96DRAFT_1603211 [Flagelloscypha sp. PMI_526]|nr:hypothetical protein DL96DRAFT_1603211 [Flagelloscypha sp. PMI_526]
MLPEQAASFGISFLSAPPSLLFTPPSLTRRGSNRRVSRPIASPAGPRTLQRSSSTASPAKLPSYGESASNLIQRPKTTHGVSLPVLAIHEEPSDANQAAPASPYAPSEAGTTKSSGPSVVTLPSQPPITLDSQTIPWKGLPLDAAVWTFESQDLQEIVARAIRSSARDNFVRLLRLEVLDQTLPAELVRLDEQKLKAKARYKFLAERRQVLMEDLCTIATSFDPKDHTTLSSIVVQLSETASSCDQTLSELLQITDRAAQIQTLLDRHSSSALAIALRKLNKSYGNRTSALLESQGKIQGLEAALEDAWKEAERLARELDGKEDEDEGQSPTLNAKDKGGDLDDSTAQLDLETGSLMDDDAGVLLDDETGIIKRAEVVSLQSHSRTHSRTSHSHSPTQPHPSLSPTRIVPIQSQVNGATKPVFTPPVPLGTHSITPTTSQLTSSRTSHESEEPLHAPEKPWTSPFSRPKVQTASIPSTSTPSTTTQQMSPMSGHAFAGTSGVFIPPNRAQRPGAETRASSLAHDITETVQSQSPKSLQDPDVLSVKSNRTARSNKSSNVAQVEAARRRSVRASLVSLRLPKPVIEEPPVPDLPQTLGLLQRDRSARRASTPGSSIYATHSFINFDMDEAVDNLAPLNFAGKIGQAPSLKTKMLSPHSGVTVDDIHVTPRSPLEEIQEVPRVAFPTSIDDELVRPRHSRNESTASGSKIPSIWMSVDSPKSPAERVATLLRGQSRNKTSSSYSKLKSLTKRYSFGTIPSITKRFTTRSQVQVPPAIQEGHYY